MRQITLFETEEKRTKLDIYSRETIFKRIRSEDFDFKNTPASTGIYGIHPYPAMLHFLVVRKLIEAYSKENSYILDPFMGSGVVAGECLINKRNFIGYDINPLAVLISKVRTTPIKSKVLFDALERILQGYGCEKPQTVEFSNIYYWFDEVVINNLSRLRQAISKIENKEVKDFFIIAFSETVRRVSKARYNEFKLLRRKGEDKNSNVLDVFQEISLRNIGLLGEFYRRFTPSKNTLQLEERNILNGIPLEDNSIDLIVTSPPYGDSRTTVAYGQFSRLSLRWLGLEECVDKTSLGAKPIDISHKLPSPLLYESIEKIKEKDDRRAREVFSFYNDLFNSIQIIGRKVKRLSYVCFIVGNRRVKGVELPTDKISADFFKSQGFKHQKTLVRAISNKRMPIENSPSNVRGDKDFTMRYEYIVILKKMG